MTLARPRTGGILALLVVIATVLAGCSTADSAGNDPTGTNLHGEVVVSAAASLTDAFGDVATAFETEHPGVDVVLNLGGSPTLREQLLEGAPADVFASADRANMDRVVADGLVADEPVVFATNRLQVAVPADNPGEVTDLADLADPELLVGLCAAAVPCGALAHQALDTAGVTASVDTEEPDVRALLTKLEEGELDAGITWATDVAASDGRVVGIDLDLGITGDYPIAALSDAPNPAAATAFVAFVVDDPARTILAEHGFGPP